MKELKEKMKKIAPNDPSMEVLKKSLAELEVKREDAAGKVRLKKILYELRIASMNYMYS